MLWPHCQAMNDGAGQGLGKESTTTQAANFFFLSLRLRHYLKAQGVGNEWGTEGVDREEEEGVRGGGEQGWGDRRLSDKEEAGRQAGWQSIMWERGKSSNSSGQCRTCLLSSPACDTGLINKGPWKTITALESCTPALNPPQPLSSTVSSYACGNLARTSNVKWSS